MRSALVHEALTHSVVGSFYEVYNTLQYGFLESHYARALERELLAKGYQVDREFSVVVQYKGETLGHLRLDMVVNKTVVIEIKATDNLHKDAQRQLLSYLRATGLEVGLLLHFAPSSARFYRIVNSMTAINPRNSRNSRNCSPAVAVQPPEGCRPGHQVRIIRFGTSPVSGGMATRTCRKGNGL